MLTDEVMDIEIRTAISSLLGRANLDQSGSTFGTRRDIYRALGYRTVLQPKDYWDRYRRGGIAKRIIEAFPKSTWRGGAALVETEDAETSTAFEQACTDLDDKLHLWQVFQRADILAGLGHFSLILLGAPGTYDSPLEKCPPDGLKYLSTFSERDITIDSVVNNQDDERYGLPEFYTINYFAGSTSGSRPLSLSGKVHHSRCIHVVEGSLDHPLYGPPRLEAVWNYLDDLTKCVGGGSEAFWKRVDGGKQIKLDPTLPMPTAEQRAELHQQIEEYTHELRRVLTTRGVDIQDLGSNVAGFGGQVAAIMDLISTTTGIPQRILMGSERGELASTTDQSNYDDRVEDRRNDFAGPCVVRPFIDKLIALGTLPEPSEYYVRWPEIKNLNEAQRMTLATAAANLNAIAGEVIVTPGEIRDKILGFEPLTPEQLQEEAAKKAPPPAPTEPVSEPTPEVEEGETLQTLERSLTEALMDDDVRLAAELMAEALRTAGDVAGHEFHGNQWTAKGREKAVKSILSKATGGERRVVNVQHLARASDKDLDELSQHYNALSKERKTHFERESAKIAGKRVEEEIARRVRTAGDVAGHEFHGNQFTSSPGDAMHSILNGEKANIDPQDVRSFISKAGKQLEDPDLTNLQVNGQQIFGGNGLGIARKDMPQIPKELRPDFRQRLADKGVKVTEEKISPLKLAPTQKEISARIVSEKLKKYEKDPNRPFPPLLVSKEGRVLDGHHHWGMVASVALDNPKIKVPIHRLHISAKEALGIMHEYDKDKGIKRKAISGGKK